MAPNITFKTTRGEEISLPAEAVQGFIPFENQDRLSTGAGKASSGGGSASGGGWSLPLNAASRLQFTNLELLNEYRRLTMTGEGFAYGAKHMYTSTVDLVNASMPIDDWLLSQGMGVGQENILVGKLALYGGMMLIAAIFLPGSILLGVMVIGLGSAVANYGLGFYDYRLAQTSAEQKLAVLRGQEAFAEGLIGGALLATGQGMPRLATMQWVSIPASVAKGIQQTTRALCLADDPYFFHLTARQSAALLP